MSANLPSNGTSPGQAPVMAGVSNAAGAHQ